MTSKDFASPRYIFTYLAELTRLIFRQEDEPILNYLDDDGILVEPEYYVPIIPMILVNGGEGIGTGFSTNIPSYDPLKIIDNIINLMENKDFENMKPYYRNFRGSIDLVNDKEYIITGNYNIIGKDEIEITELPIGIWTSPYKQFIEELQDKKSMISEYNSASCTDEKISIKIKLFDGLLEKMECNGTLMTKLKLISRKKISNIHLYNSNGQIRKYHSPESILKEFYDVRLTFYTKRKEYLIDKLNKELNILKYKVMFIEYVLDKKIIIERQKKINIINKLIELKFPKLVDSNNEESYDYLTEMSLFSLTEEKIDELNNRYKNKEEELKIVQSTSEIDQWKSELNEFKNEYIKWIEKHKIDYSKQLKPNNKLMIETDKKTVKKIVKKTVKK
jgi:DNA topoisomerase-2